MNVSCPNCATIFRVDPAKVPEAGVRTRCSICGAIFAVRRDPSMVGEHPGDAPAQTRVEPPTQAMQAADPGVPISPSSDPTSLSSDPPSPAPEADPEEVPDDGVSERVPERTPEMPAPDIPESSTEPAEPLAPTQPAPPAVSAPARPATPGAFSSAPAPAPPATPQRPARPVNPFLSQDPSLKARRLARALVSDMVVYHPAKREDGLRDGRLKELFDEEIRRSREEYAGQVGQEVADSTPYFTEALNEILAGGRQIF